MFNGGTLKELIKKLYYLQLKGNGISQEVYSSLSSQEGLLLEKSGEKYYLKTQHRKKIRVVATGGVFDLLHLGHFYTLSEAKKFGDFLVVIIARDDMIKKKNRKPIHSQEARAKMVEFLKPVDCAILGSEDPTFTAKVINPEVIVYGYDQKDFLRPEGVEIVKLDKSIDESKFKTHKIIQELGL